MIWRKLTLALLLAVSGALFGCGEKVEKVTPPPPPALKQELERIAASGEMVGSGGQAMQAEIDKIKATDPAKGEALQKQFVELTGLMNPDEIKAKAAAMAASL